MLAEIGKTYFVIVFGFFILGLIEVINRRKPEKSAVGRIYARRRHRIPVRIFKLRKLGVDGVSVFVVKRLEEFFGRLLRRNSEVGDFESKELVFFVICTNKVSLQIFDLLCHFVVFLDGNSETESFPQKFDEKNYYRYDKGKQQNFDYDNEYPVNRRKFRSKLLYVVYSRTEIEEVYDKIEERYEYRTKIVPKPSDIGGEVFEKIIKIEHWYS